ncbi:MAG TPA: Dyp-type peroxidase, partial [Gaiellales bacterium]
MRGLTRRRLLAVTGGSAAGLAGVGAAGYAATRSGGTHEADTVPFTGPHQAGVTTPPQERLMFAAFDLTVTTAAELRDLLRSWTRAAALLTAGRPVGPPGGAPDVAPADTGEAVGLPASRLTLTFGLGPGVFYQDGGDRFGLASRRPRSLAPLGPLPGDQLVAAISGGDLCVQACADDPQVAFHAVRDLARIGRGAVVMRWTQLGFGRAASTSKSQSTPRNLQGFKDGTNNLEAADAAEMRRFVWVGDDEPQAWMRGGTYVV